MATHSSVLAWRIPGMEEPGGLPSMGSHRVGHAWSDLAAAASLYNCSPQSTHHVISLLSSPVIAPVFKSKDCSLIAFASKTISKYWVCFNKVCSGERANPRQPLSIFHYYMVRMTQQANLGKALKREDEGGGLARNLQLEKVFKCEKCTSLKLLPDPL